MGVCGRVSDECWIIVGCDVPKDAFRRVDEAYYLPLHFRNHYGSRTRARCEKRNLPSSSRTHTPNPQHHTPHATETREPRQSKDHPKPHHYLRSRVRTTCDRVRNCCATEQTSDCGHGARREPRNCALRLGHPRHQTRIEQNVAVEIIL